MMSTRKDVEEVLERAIRDYRCSAHRDAIDGGGLTLADVLTAEEVDDLVDEVVSTVVDALEATS